jgi:hypothetical protein
MIKLRIEGSLLGSATACDTEVLVAISPKAFPPGKPLELVMILETEDLALSGRCIGSKKRDDAQFDLRVRLTNLRREAREKLVQAFTVLDRAKTAPSS